MEGLNTNVTIYRAQQLADDEAGGAQRGSYVSITTARARIDHRMPTLEMRAQGLSTDKLYDAVIQPATTDVAKNDLVVPSDGTYQLERFRVTGVQKPSMSLHSPRAHLRLQLERYDSGKVIELL